MALASTDRSNDPGARGPEANRVRSRASRRLARMGLGLVLLVGILAGALAVTTTAADAATAPTYASGQYLNAESGQPFCFDAQAESVTTANGGLPLSSITLGGTTPAGVTGWGLQDVNLATGSAYVCGTETTSPNTTTYPFTVTFTNSAGSATGTIDLFIYGQCTWTASSGTVSMFSTPQDLEQVGSQSAFGAAITNGETVGTSTNYPTCTDAQFIGTGLGGAFTVNSANPLPTPTDTNPSAAQGDLASSNLDLAKGCYGDAVIDISQGEESGSFGTAAKLTWPSPWANGGTCAYGSLGSNSAGGNTDTTNASCPPSQADVNEGYVACSITASTGNNASPTGSNNNSTMDVFFNGQPVPQQSTATLSSSAALPGGTVSVTGGTNWWGDSGRRAEHRSVR